MAINAYAAQAQQQPLQPFQYEPAELGAFDAEVKISHCGICHSDIHMIDDDWDVGAYPLVPGHEIIGIITDLGSQADQSLMGKRVGIGWQRGSCLNCQYCIGGEEQLCENKVETIIEHYGGFAEAIRIDSRFCHVIPDTLSSTNAAPLLCAGITVYSPLRRNNITANDRVGVIGIGGLGHLALQYADKIGCHVIAFSSSDSKKDQAQEMGADHFVVSKNRDEMKAMRRQLDVIIATANVDLNWGDYLRTLRPNGKLIFVGAPPAPASISIGTLIDKQLSVSGSSIGSRHLMREMLQFTADKGIETWTEVVPFDSVNDAVSRLRRNDVRYRFVLEH